MTETFDPADFNKALIEEFRANGGKTAGPFAQADLLLLTTTGARTGRRHTTPLVYLPRADGPVIFASKAGAPDNPAWYHNLVANPVVTVEVGADTYEADAVIVDGPERDALFAAQVERNPGFADYQAKTTRVIPVIALRRR